MLKSEPSSNLLRDIKLYFEFWWVYVLGFLAIFVLIITYALIKTAIIRTKQSRIRKSRVGNDLHTFQLAFEGESIPIPLLEFFYNYFRECADVNDFPVSPDDDVRRVYELDEEEFTDTFREFREKLKCREPSDAEWEKANDLKTVADMVRFISKLNPRIDNQSAS